MKDKQMPRLKLRHTNFWIYIAILTFIAGIIFCLFSFLAPPSPKAIGADTPPLLPNKQSAPTFTENNSSGGLMDRISDFQSEGQGSTPCRSNFTEMIITAYCPCEKEKQYILPLTDNNCHCIVSSDSNVVLVKELQKCDYVWSVRKKSYKAKKVKDTVKIKDTAISTAQEDIGQGTIKKGSNTPVNFVGKPLVLNGDDLHLRNHFCIVAEVVPIKGIGKNKNIKTSQTITATSWLDAQNIRKHEMAGCGSIGWWLKRLSKGN